MDQSQDPKARGEKRSQKPGAGTRKSRRAERRRAPRPGETSLVAAPPPLVPYPDLSPDQIEFYVRAAIHQDRTPGNLLMIGHPARLYKFPRNLPNALAEAGFNVSQVFTETDRIRSVEKIRDALLKVAGKQQPLDVLVVSGDGTLDHHVLVAAFWAFYPDLVRFRPGIIDCSGVTKDHLKSLPPSYRSAFFQSLPDTNAIDPDEDTVKEIWLLRGDLGPALRKRKSVSVILRNARRKREDPVLRIAILAALWPEKVLLRPDGFDLSGLAEAAEEKTFQGLYPFVRCFSTYPAGTAADNAVFAGVPGWGYGVIAGLLVKSRLFNPLRSFLERRLAKSFMNYFLNGSVVVPARISVVGFDGEWQRISSHAAGGPAAGHFFSADLTSKTKGLLGYLKRIPRVVFQEGVFGSTIVRVRALLASGDEKSFTEAHISEALFTNRTFIAGVGSVPTTNPTSFAGQSSLLVLPPIWSKGRNGHRVLNLRSLLVLVEAMTKGILARTLHFCKLGVGTLAGGGKFTFLRPEHQVAIKEGESIEIDYMTMDKRPRAIGIQVSGDPFQAYRMCIRTAWGPVPLLARNNSLLLAAVRRSMADLRLQQSFRLSRVYMGGLRYFCHHIGEDWTPEFTERTGLLKPPSHIPGNLPLAQRMLIDAWQKHGAGEFVDTTQSGLAALRRGRYAHNNDQSAHLLVLKEPQGTILVRQVRAMGRDGGEIYESRSYYRAFAGSYIVFRIETMIWKNGENPRILQEDQFFRSAEAFQQEAPTFFPMVARTPQEPTLLTKEKENQEREESAEEDGQPPPGETYS